MYLMRPVGWKNKMLRLTSCLFATVVVHAFHVRSVAYHHVFLAVTVLSVLFHCTHSRMIGYVDKIVAHLAYLLVLTDTRMAIQEGKGWLLVFPTWAAIFWFAQSFFDPARRSGLHVMLHVTAVVGMHMYLHELHGA